MATRRKLLQVGAGSALSQWVGGFRFAGAGEPDVRSPALHAVLVDERLAAGRRLGSQLAARGVTVLSMADDDITSLWLDTVRPIWQQGPATLAGLTTPTAMFCLEQLAWSHGLRVVFHAEHIVHPDAAVVHQLHRGGQAADLTTSGLMHAGPHWPERVAEAIATHRRQPMRFGPSVTALAPALPSGAQLLTSWIMAP